MRIVATVSVAIESSQGSEGQSNASIVMVMRLGGGVGSARFWTYRVPIFGVAERSFGLFLQLELSRKLHFSSPDYLRACSARLLGIRIAPSQITSAFLSVCKHS